MLCRILDASKEDCKFLPSFSHAFQQELAKPRHLRWSATGLILYLSTSADLVSWEYIA